MLRDMEVAKMNGLSPRTTSEELLPVDFVTSPDTEEDLAPGEDEAMAW